MLRSATSQSRQPSCVCVLGVISMGMLACVWSLSYAMPLWDFDLAFSHLWWHAPRAWYGEQSTACWFLNNYGALPGVLLAIGAFIVLVAALIRRRLRRLLLPALYIVIAFLLGPGLLVNGVLKHATSRARPRELAEFGKKQPYQMVLTQVEASHGTSFPSGHASAAFFLGILGFASATWSTRQVMWAGLALGILWGALVAWSRVASGAHFLTDVLWSVALVNAVNFVVLIPFAWSSGWRERRSMKAIASNAGTRMKACS